MVYLAFRDIQSHWDSLKKKLFFVRILNGSKKLKKTFENLKAEFFRIHSEKQTLMWMVFVTSMTLNNRKK